MRDHFEINHRPYGFALLEAAAKWLASAQVDRVISRSSGGFWIRDQGYEGAFFRSVSFNSKTSWLVGEESCARN